MNSSSLIFLFLVRLLLNKKEVIIMGVELTNDQVTAIYKG